MSNQDDGTDTVEPLLPVDKPGLDLFASIDLNLSRVAKAVETDCVNRERNRQRRLLSQPNSIELVQAPTVFTGVAGTIHLVSFGRPSMGRQWSLQTLISSGMSAEWLKQAATITGALVGWYVGSQPVAGQPRTAGLAPQGAQTPQLRWFTDQSNGVTRTDKAPPIIVRDSETLYATVVETDALGSGYTWVLHATAFDEGVKDARPVIDT